MTLTSKNKNIIKILIEQIKQVKDSYHFNLEEAKKEINDALKLSEFKMLEQVNDNTIKHHYYITILIECKGFFSQLQTIEDVMFSKLWAYYKYESDVRLKTVEDYKRHIHSNSDWIYLQSFKNKVKIDIDYLDHVHNLFVQRGFAAGNAIKLMQN